MEGLVLSDACFKPSRPAAPGGLRTFLSGSIRITHSFGEYRQNKATVALRLIEMHRVVV